MAQQLIEKEVIFAEDVEQIFGKRKWASRSEEIMSANEISKEYKEAAEKAQEEKDQKPKDEPKKEGDA